MNNQQQTFLKKITEVLENDSRVLAAWLEGSFARKEEDSFSDIDLWVCVKDKHFDEWIEGRELFAAKLGSVLSILYPKTLDQDENVDSFQVIFEDMPLSATLDVDVQKESRNFRFTKNSAAEECKVLFDKTQVIQQVALNSREVEEYVRAVFTDISVRFWHSLPLVSKFLNRNDLLEATHAYMERLRELITLFRILYTPEKIDWVFKDIEYDLPDDAIKILYDLLPEPDVQSLTKQLRHLAKVYAKQSTVVGKRLHIDSPAVLIKHTISALL
ncbi:MAG TPA: nucleotidyltransferase domain-containing protein [Patescibacteria group bacterium]|nr:nucleotidyltransferase domain-containing protein [Patescibacteria group bacterium]